MEFRELRDIAEKAIIKSRDFGYDFLRISAMKHRNLGIRIALGRILQENTWNECADFIVHAMWQGRESYLSLGVCSLEDLLKKLRKLKCEMEGQSVSEEWVLPETLRGSFSWNVACDSFEDVYQLEDIYSTIEDNVKPLRDQKIRVTGFIKAQEREMHEFTTSGFDLYCKDHGIAFDFTVDNPETKAVGAEQGALVRATPEGIRSSIKDTIQGAYEMYAQNTSPFEISPGEYTVILGPRAVSDILRTSGVYGLFDRRKIDEGRTYLSKKMEDLSFPEGLYLSQSLLLPLEDGIYQDLPFNHRCVPCSTLELIKNGRINDLHTEAYWAKKCSLRETFASGYAPPLVLGVEPNSPMYGKYKGIKDLIAGTENGIYVANTWYLRMVAEMDGIITGMTRDGIFEIKNGKITRPLRHMRWHENPFKIFQSIDGVTDEKKILGHSRLSGGSRYGGALASVPSIRVRDFHFSSATKF